MMTKSAVYLKKWSMNDRQHIVCHPLQMKEGVHLLPNNQHIQQHIKSIHPAPKQLQTHSKGKQQEIYISSIWRGHVAVHIFNRGRNHVEVRVSSVTAVQITRCSKSNVKHKKKLTKLSVRLQEWSTTLYSPARRPKVLDKHVQHVDDRYNAEAHNAPWTMEGDCGEQFLNQ
jgi:phosphorylcholine metabolism protein LicD